MLLSLLLSCMWVRLPVKAHLVLGLDLPQACHQAWVHMFILLACVLLKLCHAAAPQHSSEAALLLAGAGAPPQRSSKGGGAGIQVDCPRSGGDADC